MVTGKIKVTWTAKDYKKSLWRTNKNHYLSVKTSIQNKKLYRNNIGVYINNDIHNHFLTIADTITKKFNLKKSVVALNKMTPGQVLPFHVDDYPTYMKKNKIKNKNNIVRIILFLEDSKPGHQLWIKEKICIGPAGSYFGWIGPTKHMAANLGEDDRYTLQITGLQD
jgi:hypothetical protein